MKILCIDHYDSFTFNLIDWLGSHKKNLNIIRIYFDDSRMLARYIREPLPFVLSAGPHSPEEAGATRRFVEAVAGRVPVLGICLGAQILGVQAGYSLVASSFPLHGGVKKLYVASEHSRLFSGFETGSSVACYHSLILKKPSMAAVGDETWQVVAKCSEGEIMAIEKVRGALWLQAGVQFHPESFLSQHTGIIADNWLTEVRRWYRSCRSLGN